MHADGRLYALTGTATTQIKSAVQSMFLAPDGTFFALDRSNNLWSAPAGTTALGNAASGVLAIVEDNEGTLYELTAAGSLNVYALSASSNSWSWNPLKQGIRSLAVSSSGSAIDCMGYDGNDWQFDGTTWTLLAGPHFVINAPATATAGQSFPVSVTVLDSLGEVATGYTGSIQIASSDLSASSIDYTFTSANSGVYTSDFVLDTSGMQTLTASDDAGLALPVAAGLTVSPGAVNGLGITVGAAPVIGSPLSVTVSAEDEFGNVVPGYTGTVSLSSTDGQTWSGYTFTAADGGTHQFTITPSAVGYQQITAMDQGYESGTASVVVSPATAVPADSTLVVTPSTVAAGGTAVVTLTARDAYGDQEASGGLPVDFGLYSFGDNGTLSTVTDNGDGTYSATFTAGNTPGSNMVLAIMNQYVIPSFPMITVTPPPGSEGDTISLSDSANPSIFGQQVALTATVAATLPAGQRQPGP